LNSKDIEKILDFINFLKTANRDYEKFTNIFKFAEMHGVHITNTGFYSPIPTVKDLSENDFGIKDANIDWQEQLQINILNQITQYSAEFEKLVQENIFDMHNGAFETHDAPVYYSMIRHFNPSTVLEVGAGHSTKLASIAASKNKTTKVIAVDPHLSGTLKKEIPKSVELIEKPIQTFDVSFFDKLKNNDILFIDSSHVSKIGSDVNFLFLDVLPKLNPGVLIHVHDIFLPRQYPKEWIRNDHQRFWNEQYLLNAFLISNKEFEVLLANSYMGLKHPDLLQKMYNTNLPAGGGSFWMRRINS